MSKGKKKKGLLQKEEKYFTFHNGDSYRGEYAVNFDEKKVYRHGTGTYFKLNGDRYSGRWSEDVLVGPAEIYYKKRNKYKGSLTAENEYTAGTFTFGDTSELKGDFKKNFKGGTKDVVFQDPNKKQWDHELNEDKTQIVLKYNWLKAEEEPLCDKDEDSATDLCLSECDTVSEEIEA